MTAICAVVEITDQREETPFEWKGSVSVQNEGTRGGYETTCKGRARLSHRLKEDSKPSRKKGCLEQAPEAVRSRDGTSPRPRAERAWHSQGPWVPSPSWGKPCEGGRQSRRGGQTVSGNLVSKRGGLNLTLKVMEASEQGAA